MHKFIGPKIDKKELKIFIFDLFHNYLELNAN